MAKQSINVGATANDKKGDSLRAAFQKVNSNFTELYDRAVNTDAQTLTLTGNTLAITGGNTVELTIAPTGDLKGSVFADDSTLLVDAVNASIPYTVLSGAPAIPADVSDLTDTGNLLGSGSAFSGSYNDLTDTPAIPTDITDLTDLTNFLPTDITDLTDLTDQIPTDISDLTDVGSLLNSITHTDDINITINNDDSSTYVWNFSQTGDLTAPGDITTGLINTGGRFIQDCADGITSIRWVNVDPGDPVQIIRVYSDDPKINSDTAFERAQIGINWSASQVQSGLTITSFDSTDPDSANQIEHTWQFQGDGALTFPDATVQTTAYPGPPTGFFNTGANGDTGAFVLPGGNVVFQVNGVSPVAVVNSEGIDVNKITTGASAGGDNLTIVTYAGGNINIDGGTTGVVSLASQSGGLSIGRVNGSTDVYGEVEFNNGTTLFQGGNSVTFNTSVDFNGVVNFNDAIIDWVPIVSNVLVNNGLPILPTQTLDISGSVFADDSTVLVDGVDGKIVGPVDTSSVTSTGNIAVTGQNTKFVTEFGTLGYNNDRGTWGLEVTGGFGSADLTSATIDNETGNIAARYTASLTNDGRFSLPVSSTANISQLSSAPNNANASLRLTGGNAVEIVSDSQDINHTWTFDADGDLTIPGRLILASGGVQETFQPKTDATGVVTHDCALGHIFYHTSPDANWTANFTNINLASSTSTNLVLVIEQGTPAYYPSAVQIGGVAQTIKWLGNVTPTPSANKTEIATFTIFNSGVSLTVLGSYSTYG